MRTISLARGCELISMSQITSKWAESLCAVSSQCFLEDSTDLRYGFLGCPMTYDAVLQRSAFADVYCFAVSNDQCIGYAFGYSAGETYGRVRHISREQSWGESRLLNHPPDSTNAGCLFQVALLPSARYHGLGRVLVRIGTEFVLKHSHRNLSWGFIPADPMNSISLNTARRSGYSVYDEFEGDSSPIARWITVRTVSDE